MVGEVEGGLMEMWEDLLSQIEVREEEGSGICSTDELEEFEAETGITLPEDYKAFCQVFGSGQFGDGMSISCLGQNDPLTLEILRNVLEDEFDSELDYRVARGESPDIESIREILDAALVFGGNGSTNIVFWDLRTYSAEDKSYDIYMSRIEGFPGVSRIGRSFSEFVETFCLGIKPFAHFPDWTHPDPQALRRTFIRVPRR